MTRKLLAVSFAALFMVGFATGTSRAFKADFESPLVDSLGQVVGSEAKANVDGEWKVELVDAPRANETHAVCLLDNNQGATFLADISFDDEGEAKATDDDGIKIPSGNTWEAPVFAIVDGTGDCGGTVHYRTGFDTL